MNEANITKSLNTFKNSTKRLVRIKRAISFYILLFILILRSPVMVNEAFANGSSQDLNAPSYGISQSVNIVSFTGTGPVLQHNFSLLGLSEQNEKTSATGGKTGHWNWHKIFGWSAIASAATTVVTGFAVPTKIHCGLAGLSTGLAALTCINGYYNYHDIIGFHGDIRYTTHAIMGTFATIGFAASLALADGFSHAVIGGSSGIMFMITVGIVYF